MLAASPNRPAPMLLQAGAPAQPALGAACNGCGVCCAAESCPLGILLTGRRQGACQLLVWDPARSHYLCSALAFPGQYWRWLPPSWAKRLAYRWIAAGRGYDAHFPIE